MQPCEVMLYSELADSKFVQFRVSNKDLRNSTAYGQCQIKLLKQEISNKKRNLRSLRRDLTSVRNEVSLI